MRLLMNMFSIMATKEVQNINRSHTISISEYFPQGVLLLNNDNGDVNAAHKQLLRLAGSATYGWIYISLLYSVSCCR